MILSPFPWWLNPTSPNPPLRVLSLLFRRYIGARIFPIRHRVTISNNPKFNVFAPHAAIGDNSTIPVDVALAALDGRRANELVQRHGGDLSAAIELVRGVKAWLALLWGVDAVKPDALAMYLYRVAVDDRSATNHVSESSA